jgi:hypothetical protein
MAKKRTNDEIAQFPTSAAEDRQCRGNAGLNETVDDYLDLSTDVASEPNLSPVKMMELGITVCYRRISGRRRGLCSGRDPFGDEFLGTEDLLLCRIAQLELTGNVELYMSSDWEVALGFSHIKTAADLRHIKQQLESASNETIWREQVRALKETHHEADLYLVEKAEALEEEQGVNGLVADQWRIETLIAIRRRFKYLGALEYKNGSLVTVLDYRPGTQFMDLVKNEIRS